LHTIWAVGHAVWGDLLSVPAKASAAHAPDNLIKS
jgi:hypothetical protein